MNAPNKQHAQPLNPFRTQPRGEDHNGALFANSLVQACYGVSVGVLTIAVAVVAWTTFSQLPNPQEDLTLVAGPHRISVADMTDLKILNKPARMGGGVRGQSRIPPPQLADMTASDLFEKVAHVKPIVVKKRSKHDGIDEDDSSKDDLLSFHHDDEEEAADTSLVNDAGELLLRPAEAHLKFLGETKEQVKQEIEQEDFGDHAFGVQQDDKEDTEPGADVEATAQLTDVDGSGEGESADKRDARDSPEVHVIRRKGELKTLISVDKDESTIPTSEKSVNATTSRLQAVIEIAAGEESDHLKYIDQVDEGPPHEQARAPISGGDGEEQLLLRRKRLHPIAITADE